MSKEKKTEHTPEKENQEIFQSKVPAGKRTALLRYMAVLFAAAFLLVLLSYVMETRKASQQVDQLNKSNNGALARAQALQEENRQLQEDLAAAKTAQTNTQTQSTQETENIKNAHNALALVMTTQPKEGDVSYANAVETVKNLKHYLSPEAVAAFEALMASREAAAEQENWELTVFPGQTEPLIASMLPENITDVRREESGAGYMIFGTAGEKMAAVAVDQDGVILRATVFGEDVSDELMTFAATFTNETAKLENVDTTVLPETDLVTGEGLVLLAENGFDVLVQWELLPEYEVEENPENID